MQYTEDQSIWLEEWLEENEVRTLDGCKTWKASIPVLQSAVIGVETLIGSGCRSCNFSHERKREVTYHMKKAHGVVDDIAPISCSVQRVFSSQLHAFWRIETPIVENNPLDEGLVALRHFHAEFRRFEKEDQRSAVGIRALFYKVNE